MDYFGPAPTAGPYTEEDGGGGGGGGGARGAVPVSPDGPGDIVPAVEMGEGREHGGAGSPGEEEGESEGWKLGRFKGVPETVEDRAELP